MLYPDEQTQNLKITASRGFDTPFLDYFASCPPGEGACGTAFQNHERVIKGFMGQTTSFNKELIKSSVLIMGDNKAANEARYIHGEFGKGTWTFYGGHDPEDFQHMVGDPPTDLALHPNSPGYRLILNNVLFPAAKKKKQKT